MVLQQMEMLDQQIALARACAEQRQNVFARGGIDLAALGQIAAAPPTTMAGTL